VLAGSRTRNDNASAHLSRTNMDYRILGPLEIADGGPPLPLPASLRALVAVLLLHANEVVSPDRLRDELWGEEQPGSGAAALQVRVSQLRKALGPAAHRLETRPAGYVLLVHPSELDLDRFSRLVEEAGHGEPATAAAVLRDALSLWRGSALADLAFEPFAQPAIHRLEELRLIALERRIEADLALGRHAELVPELEALVAEHPLRERSREQLMLALYRSGRQVEALDEYRAAREMFASELGIEPRRELRELEQAILRHDPALASATGATRARSILAVPSTDTSLDRLLSLAIPLASRPVKELIVTRVVQGKDGLAVAAAVLEKRRQELIGRGVAARCAAFVGSSAGDDVIRFADEQGVELLVVDGGEEALESLLVQRLLSAAPCDVAVLVGGGVRPGPLLVPFVGADHDWAAIEIAAWAAGAFGAPLRLAGPSGGPDDRDASRLLANASLAIQRTLGVAAEPVLLAPGPDALVAASADAALVVVGLSDRWQAQGLGATRRALIDRGHAPVVLVRGGLRPGGLAPDASLTRFTWTLKS